MAELPAEWSAETKARFAWCLQFPGPFELGGPFENATPKTNPDRRSICSDAVYTTIPAEAVDEFLRLLNTTPRKTRAESAPVTGWRVSAPIHHNCLEAELNELERAGYLIVNIIPSGVSAHGATVLVVARKSGA